MDAHTSKIASGTVSDNFRGFHFVIDGKEKYPFTTRNGMLLKTGQDNEVMISATRFEANEDIKSVESTKRNCYFSDEHPLKLHKVYTQSNCIFQCKVERVQHQLQKKIDKRCIPWFYPVEDEYLFELCDPWQTNLFQTLMKELSDDKCSECLPDCTTTKYQTTITSAPFKECDRTNLGISPLCDISTEENENIMMNPPMWRNTVEREYSKFNGEEELPDFIRNQAGIESNVRQYVQDEKDIENLVLRGQREKELSYDALEEDITIVNFFFDEPNIIQYTTFLRMTGIDFISSVCKIRVYEESGFCLIFNKTFLYNSMSITS